MTRHLVVLALSCSLLLLSSPSSPGQDAPKDSAYSVIPSDVFFALAVRSYKDLKEEGDKLTKDADIILPIRPSAAIDWLFTNLKVRKGLDEDAPFAVMLTSPDFLRDTEESIVYAVPFTDKEAMAANFGRKPEDFAEGKLVENLVDNALGVEFGHVALRGRWFYVGSKKAIHTVLAMKSVEETLTPDQRKLLPRADLVFHFARAGFADEWKKELVVEIEKAADDDDERIKNLATSMLPLAENFRLGEIAFRVDGGLAAQGFALFDPGEKVEAALQTLGGGPGASHLNGLPEGPIIASYGATGDGRVNGNLARDFLSLAADDIFGRQGREASVDRKALFGIFDEVWTSLRGSRGAIYENVESEKLGMFSALTILDTDDAGDFLARIQDLALYVNYASDQLDDGKKPEVDAAKLAHLIEDLAAADFRVRAEATTRLALLGDGALPALKVAMESSDPEVKMRAAALHGRLENLNYKGGQDFIKGDVFSGIRPRFVFFPEAEKRGEYSVDIAQLTLAGDTEENRETLGRVLGPDWQKIRLVRKGAQVVVLAGSNLNLLDVALANLDAGKPGLESAGPLEIYRGRSVPVRKAEFHTSVARILSYLAPEEIRLPKSPAPADGVTPPLTSGGLSIQPASLAFDVFFPPSELGFYFNAGLGM